MRNTILQSTLTALNTYELYKNQFLMLAKSVFVFKNLSKYVDTSVMDGILIRQGSIAFFYEDVLDAIVCLPYRTLGLNQRITKKPKMIEVYDTDSGYTKILKANEFVIMYDNNMKLPIYNMITQYAERYSFIQRSIDANIHQQKTPRIWKVPENKVKTFEDMLNSYDGFEVNIMAYADNIVEDVSVVLEPAPYVADKLETSKEKLFNEFLRFIGVANLSVQKKERNIRDEIQASQGGTIASRYSRYSTRKQAIDEINELFADKLTEKLEVAYYDGEPTTEEKEDEDVEIDNEVIDYGV